MLSNDLAFFEGAFDALNLRFFESALSKPVITIQASPKAYVFYGSKRGQKSGIYI